MLIYMKKRVTSRGSEATGISSGTFSAELDEFRGWSMEDSSYLLFSIAPNPLLWASPKIWEVVSRANLVTRENFSSTCIERSRAGSCGFCLGLPLYCEILNRPSRTFPLDLSWLSSKGDSPTAMDVDCPLAPETALGNSKDDKVLCRTNKSQKFLQVQLWRSIIK